MTHLQRVGGEPFDYVRAYYKVPAAFGRGVTVDGKPGIITEDQGHHIGVTFDDGPATRVSTCHPTWRVVYGEMRERRKLTRSQRRYQEYVRVADLFTSFRQFLAYHGSKP